MKVGRGSNSHYGEITSAFFFLPLYINKKLETDKERREGTPQWEGVGCLHSCRMSQLEPCPSDWKLHMG